MANGNTSDPGSLRPPEPFVGELIGLALRVVLAVIGSVMIFSAVVGNSTLIFIVVKHFMKNRRKNLHDLFIANLVLDDLLLMGYWFTFFILDLALGYHPVADGSHCTANAIIVLTMYMVNLDSLVSLSFNRYLHVCYSHQYPRVFTLPRTVCWCLLIWIVSFLLTLPPLWGGVAGFYFYNPKTHVCSFNRDGFTYLKVMVILYTIVPPTFISYFHVAIFRRWKKARMSLSERYPLGDKVQKKKNLIAKLTAGKHDKNAVAESVAAGTLLDDHQQDDCIISRTEKDKRICSKLRNETDVFCQSVDVKDIETAETTTTTYPSQCGAASVEALPTTSPSSARDASKQLTSSEQGKRQDHGTTAQKHNQLLRKKSRNHEEAFVRSLLIVCVLALVTFLPYTVLLIVDTYIEQPKEIHLAANLVIFINNSVNWIVYGVMNPAYKRGYVKYARLVLKKCRP